MKRELFVFTTLILFFVIFSLSLAFAQDSQTINLEIEKNIINDVIIKELDNSATFEFTIKNKGPTDSFEIYSLVGIDFLPKGTFTISNTQTKKITVEATPQESVKKNSGYFTFVYKIKGSNTGIQEDKLTIRIVNLENALYLSADSITPDNDKTTIYLENIERFDFSNIEATFTSAFFQTKKNFSLSALEKKSFETELDKEKLIGLVAGQYILDADLKIDNTEQKIKSTMKFLEKSGISTIESKEGWLIYRHEIEKKNEGNTLAVAQITISKNLFSRLFTNFNIPHDKAETKGLTTHYTWQQELRPGQSLKIISKTNWFVPILIVIAVIVFVFLSNTYFKSDIILKKRINHVRTKGGEFALKVTILVRARKYAERINVIDKLPPMLKLFERYGSIAPDKIDEINRRIEWNIESLNEHEETVLSYIIYSKIGVIGKFELPPATAVYEREGKIKETSSNRVFFVSERKKKTEEE